MTTQKNYKEVIVSPLQHINQGLLTLSFFSGIGGLDKGAKRAGFQSLLQSDWWEVAGRAFELNIPVSRDMDDWKASEGIFLAGKKMGDISRMSFDSTDENRVSIRNIIETNLAFSLREREIAVAMGGPPCQGASLANSDRCPFDIRNELIFELLRIITEVKPKVGLIEQVPSILGHDMLPLMNLIIMELNMMTDYYWAFKVLNAMDYGARQDRKRIIFMLVRKDLGVKPSFPEPTTVDLSKVAVGSLLPHIHHFSPGQYLDGIKSAKENVFCTMTATGSEKLYEFDGIPRSPHLREKLVLTELEGYNLEGLPRAAQNRLLGNMVQISFAEALFRHIRVHILKEAWSSDQLGLAA
jgi:DNA-cytosine methyltransferase